MNLKLLALIVTIIGICTLLIVSFLIPPTPISSQSELKENAFVKTTGKVISERNYSDFSIIKLDNNVTLTCNCKGLTNKSIEVEGKVERYENELQIASYKIREK